MRFGYCIIYVPDPASALAFYEAAFGMTRRLLHESGDFAELETGGTRLAFTSHRLGAQAVPIPYTPLDPHAAPAGFEVTLLADDVDAAFERAVAAGAEALSAPHDEPWGQRVSYVRDPVGVLIGIASPMG